ncbi:MAG: flagellar biosynthesis protein FlgL [Lachnospiraceae bacterium]|nr:flagellar biosynthesis protein FlgL [Lachnospiraceae bacterium]
MRINHNISALQTNAHMRTTGNSLDKAMQKLSSGYKINKAADDAAGMAISRKMKTQIEGLERASMNGSDGISVIQTAEGALNEVTSLLQRCRELAVQGASDTNTGDDRLALQTEINQLLKEVDRISETTEFNTKSLLNGDLDNNSYSDIPGVDIIYTSDTVMAGNYDITVVTDARQAVINCEAPSLSDVSEAEAGTLYINGVPVDFKEDMTQEEWFASLRSTCDVIGIDVFFGSDENTEGPAETAGYEKQDIGSGNLIFVSKGYGSAQKIELKCDNPDLADALGIMYDEEETVSAKGVDAEISLGESGFSETSTYSAEGNIVTVKDGDGFEMKIKLDPGLAGTVFTDAKGDGSVDQTYTSDGELEVKSTLLAAGSMFLQLGANEDQTMEVKLPRIDSETLGIRNLNVCTYESANYAISMFDNAVNAVSAMRSKLGAYQNRLEHTVTNLDTAGLNMTEAMSRIEDADMAEEMTAFTQQNVLQQAGTAMLAQANERPQTILSLLNG